MADIFCPDYWTDLERNQKGAHHLNHKTDDNCFRNLILLPVNLHNIMNGVQKTALFSNGGSRRKVMSPLQIAEVTGLSLEDIIQAAKGQAVRTEGSYVVFAVNGFELGFKFK